jgi:hypothetical protein
VLRVREWLLGEEAVGKLNAAPRAQNIPLLLPSVPPWAAPLFGGVHPNIFKGCAPRDYVLSDFLMLHGANPRKVTDDLASSNRRFFVPAATYYPGFVTRAG